MTLFIEFINFFFNFNFVFKCHNFCFIGFVKAVKIFPSNLWSLLKDPLGSEIAGPLDIKYNVAHLYVFLHLFFTSTKSGWLCKCPSLLLPFPAWSLVSDTITYTGDNLTFDPSHSLKSVDNHSIADRARVTPHSPTSFWDRRLKEERNGGKKNNREKNMKDMRLFLAVTNVVEFV